ncbi:glycosyltransferase family 39 protein [Anaerolineales bacterium HSG24]|nr:glycosyltransferase family 39 protein [Anaerolineales bacterium HSG24]
MAISKQNISLFLLLLLATGMRFYNLAGQSLWSDEGNSVALIKHGYSDIAQRTAYDIHPPFYYWLLKLCTAIFGTTEIGLRALSAMLGIALVYLTYLLGRRLLTPRIALIATSISALSPLQIHYSQEVRMYMLLAVLSTLTVFLLSCLHETIYGSKLTLATSPYLIGYLTVVSAGLYTHYAYPLILVVVGLFFLFELICNRPATWYRALINVALLHLIPILLYLPWLPIAWRQLTSWPSEKSVIPLNDMIGTVATTLIFGLSWPYETKIIAMLILSVSIAIPLIKILSIYRATANLHAENPCESAFIRVQTTMFLLLIWLILPISVTLLIFSPAFLKFLLIATPPLTLLLAVTIAALPRPVQALFLMMLLTSSLVSLTHYQTNPAYARDNYRGIVNFIKAVQGKRDAIILNAEGQQDVFNYYYYQNRANPTKTSIVYPLPRQRPLDKQATITELQQITAQATKIYAVYWATQQADPHGLIEGWLDENLFKATDQWYGNVRLVTYGNQIRNQADCTNRIDAECSWIEVGQQFGDISLLKYSLVDRTVTPADILQLQLIWQTGMPLAQNYTIFGQLLDNRNHLVGQRDASPKLPTTQWSVNELLTDTLGIFIEPGTPPGQHQLIIGLYDSQTGERLPILNEHGDMTTNFVELNDVTIAPTTLALPIEAYNIQHYTTQSIENVTLMGYDLYKVGHRSTPDTPIHSGDPIRLVAYWQRNQTWDQVSGLSNELTLQVVDRLGRATPIQQSVPIAGVDYPPTVWQPTEIVRAQYDLFLAGLETDLYRIKFERQTGGDAETGLFQVE